MTKTNRITADRIAANHHCEILPTATKVPALRVLPFHRDGDSGDRRTIEVCRKAIEAAGISTDGWVS